MEVGSMVYKKVTTWFTPYKKTVSDFQTVCDLNDTTIKPPRTVANPDGNTYGRR